MAKSDVTRRSVRVFARDPALGGEVGVVRLHVPLAADATHFDDGVVWIRRGGAIFPPQIEVDGAIQPIPHEGVTPTVVTEVFKAQMLFAVIHGTRDAFGDALGRNVHWWWKDSPLMVRFDCKENGNDLLNAYYRRLPPPDPHASTGLASDVLQDLASYVSQLGWILKNTPTGNAVSDDEFAAVTSRLAELRATAGQLCARWKQETPRVRNKDLAALATSVLGLVQQATSPTGAPGPVKEAWAGENAPAAGGSTTAGAAPASPPRVADDAKLPASPSGDAAPAALGVASGGPPAKADEPDASPRQELRFGIYSSVPSDLEQAGAAVSTALMQDVIVHETVHALLDGLRPHLLLSPCAESMAFHEGFADLVVVFSRFANRDLVRQAIERSRDLGDTMLASIGTQFGFTTSDDQRPIRSAIAADPEPWSSAPPAERFDPLGSPHALGAILLSAIFAAFRVVFRDKAAPILKLAQSASSPHVIDLLSHAASDIGLQFLRMLIRAIDYMPPVDARFGDYLRALLTADAVDYPEDKWRYRERLVEQFRRYRIPVLIEKHDRSWRPSMHVTALLWEPYTATPRAPLLHAEFWGGRHTESSTCTLGAILGGAKDGVTTRSLGLSDLDRRITLGRRWESSRVVDARKVIHERGIELIQERDASGGRTYGGTTLLFRPDDKGAWALAYAIYRRVDSATREAEQRHFLNVCDRDLALAWRSLGKGREADALIQHFTRYFDNARCRGEHT